MGISPGLDRPRRRRGCCGCGPLLLLLLLLVAIGAAFYFRVPQKLGLMKPASERLLSAVPDRGCAAQILGTLAARQINTSGLTLWVLPYKDKAGAILYADLDASAGFTFPKGPADPIVGFMTTLATNEGSVSCEIKRVAIEYRFGEDLSMIKLTASTQELQDHASGKLTRQQLMKAMEGKVDPAMMLLSGGAK